jgi:trimeric autotransporter adhesin
MHDGVSVLANYTWSRATDTQFSESNFFAGGSAILDNFDVDREDSLSVVDIPHRLNVTVVFSRRGWTASAVGAYQSGFPISVLQGHNNSGLFGSNQRPNIAGGVGPQLTDDPEDAYDVTCRCIRWLNAAAWSEALPFTFGNAPRTDGRVRTPIRRNWDISIERAQRVAAATVAVRAEVINVFNFVDFRGPSIVHGDPSFGQIREAAGFPRLLQLSVRLAW